MIKIVSILAIFSCYHFQHKIREEELFKNYIYAKDKELVQITVKGFPVKKNFTLSSDLNNSELDIMKSLDQKKIMSILASTNAINKAVIKIKNIIYELKTRTFKLNDYSGSRYFKYEIDKLISSNAEIIKRKWNNKCECELTMSLDISLVNDLMKYKIVKKYDSR